MSFSRTGFSRKSGKIVLSVALLSSFMLTSCSPADTEIRPSNTQGVTKFKSEAFDLSKQTSVHVENKASNILLAGGVVSLDTTTATTVTYTPYEDKGKAWKYTADQQYISTTKVNFMRWKLRSYLVLSGSVGNTDAVTGKNTTTEVVTVIDAETGKVANTVKGDAVEVGTKNYDSFFLKTAPTESNVISQTIYATFMKGLIYRNGNGQIRLTDPLTGKTIEVNDRGSSPRLMNNEAGFYSDSYYGGNMPTSTTPRAKATFRNFVLLVTEEPGYTEKSGEVVESSKFTLKNSVTKQTVSELVCRDVGDPVDTSYSPNFRYIDFFGKLVFDVEKGAAFCAAPVKSEESLTVTDIDNNGNMYAYNDSKYLKMNIEEPSKVETLVDNYASVNDLPILITDKGSGLFYSEQDENTLVVVPAKTPVK